MSTSAAPASISQRYIDGRTENTRLAISERDENNIGETDYVIAVRCLLEYSGS